MIPGNLLLDPQLVKSGANGGLFTGARVDQHPQLLRVNRDLGVRRDQFELGR